jgi:hypothetical protein
VSAPLQAFVFSSYLLNVLLQLANKNGIQNKQKKKLLRSNKTITKCHSYGNSMPAVTMNDEHRCIVMHALMCSYYYHHPHIT